jgi:hypothetical protein
VLFVATESSSFLNAMKKNFPSTASEGTPPCLTFLRDCSKWQCNLSHL